MLENITWLGQSGFRIITKSGKTIYIDPWKISGDSSKADYILITHEHFDHFSPEDIAKIRKENTKIFCPHECIKKIGGQAESIKPGREIKEGKITIKTVPAYNTDKEYHPKENKWVGYVIEADDQKIYHAGDTDLIPEMEKLEDIDVAMLPVSGTYVMNSQQAAKAVEKISPKKVIPMHYGDVVGSSKDAEKLKEKFPERTEIMDKG